MGRRHAADHPQLQDGGLAGELRFDLRDHDAAPPVTPPAQYQIFSPLLLLEDSSLLQYLENTYPMQEETDSKDVLPTDEWQDDSGWFQQDPSVQETVPDYPQ